MAKEVDTESVRPTGTKPKVRFHYQLKSKLNSALSTRTTKSNKKVTFNENPIILNSLTKDYLIKNHPEIIPTQELRPIKSAQTARIRKVQSKSKSITFPDNPILKPISHSSNLVMRTKLSPETMKNISTESSNVFSRPELHSSLWVAEKLKAIQLEDFNSELSVRNKLETCGITKQKIDRLSSKPVNVPHSEVVFHDIVPLEFDQEALLMAAAEEKEAKLKAALPVSRNQYPKPDVDEYLTDDLQPEFFTLPNPVVNFLQFRQPVKAARSSVYSLYQHRRMWENLP